MAKNLLKINYNLIELYLTFLIELCYTKSSNKNAAAKRKGDLEMINNYDGKHFGTLYNGSAIALMSDDSNFTHETLPVVFCETDADFTAFARGEDYAAKFDEEFYVKVQVSEGEYETMELSSANEYLASLEAN
jgi:hypothetical protein